MKKKKRDRARYDNGQGERGRERKERAVANKR